MSIPLPINDAVAAHDADNELDAHDAESVDGTPDDGAHDALRAYDALIEEDAHDALSGVGAYEADIAWLEVNGYVEPVSNPN